CVVRTLEGETWLALDEPEDESAPMRLTAEFFDGEGEKILRLEENEWVCFRDQWDVEVVGTLITVRSGPAAIALQIPTCPPHDLFLERLTMQKGKLEIQVEPSGRTILRRDGGMTELDEVMVARADCIFLV